MNLVIFPCLHHPRVQSSVCVCVCVCETERERENSLLISVQHAARLGKLLWSIR